MPARKLSDLTTRIDDDLANNNAGLISAEDVRENIKDVALSITTVVGSGDFETETPFLKNVKIQAANPQSTDSGSLIVESGISFPNNGNTFQYVAYPGAANISHNALADLDTGDEHTQYIPINGSRHLTANLATDDNWINASGNVDSLGGTYNDRGFKFDYVDASNETINVGSKSTVEFNTDSSKMANAKGVAKAWISFGWNNSSNVNEVNNSFNIASLERTHVGRYKVTFTEAFPDTLYIAIGTSNGRTAGATATNFENNTVGIVERTATYMTVGIIADDGNAYVDAAVVDIVVYGTVTGETKETKPTITNSVV